MPHVIVKLGSGRSESQKADLAEQIARAVTAALGCAEDLVSVGIDDVDPRDWTDKVYEPDILGKIETIYRKPGYKPS